MKINWMWAGTRSLMLVCGVWAVGGMADERKEHGELRNVDCSWERSLAEIDSRFGNVRRVRSDFYSVRLSGCRANEAQLHGIHFHHAQIENASFRRAEWVDVALVYATLEDVDLHQGDFSNVSVHNSSLVRVDMARLNCSRCAIHADLEQVDLTDASFQRAWFTGSFSGVNLSGADLRGAYLAIHETGANQWVDARFDSATSLPFSREEALRRGMIFVERVEE